MKAIFLFLNLGIPITAGVIEVWGFCFTKGGQFLAFLCCAKICSQIYSESMQIGEWYWSLDLTNVALTDQVVYLRLIKRNVHATKFKFDNYW